MKFEEIRVRPLDMQKFNDSLNNCELYDKWAMTSNPPLLISEECVGWDGEVIEFPAFAKSKIDENGQKSIPVIPEFMVKLSISEIEKFAGPSVNIVEFMGSRYNYNLRIKSNQHQWLLHWIKNT